LVEASGDDGSVERDEKGEEAEDESIGNMMVYPQRGKKMIARGRVRRLGGGKREERDGRMGRSGSATSEEEDDVDDDDQKVELVEVEGI
jgi:hypothetical protein